MRLVRRGCRRPPGRCLRYLYGDTTLKPPSASHRTALVVGTYSDRGPGVVGGWTATPGVARGLAPQISDNGTYYAAKDFYDSRGGRRILWGWAQIPGGAQALPREITWHPELQQLVFSPLPEQRALRDRQVTSGAVTVGGSAGASVRVGSWSEGTARQAEVIVHYPVPSVATTFGVAVLGQLEAFVEFVPAAASGVPQVSETNSKAAAGPGGSWSVRVGIRSGTGGTNLTRYMPHTDLRGGDYNKNTSRHHPPGTDPHVCQAACDAAAECMAWTYVIRGEPAGSGDCCLKKMAPTGNESSLDLCPRIFRAGTSGVKTPRTVTGCGGDDGGVSATEAWLSLLPSDTEVQVRVFTDHAIAEIFFAGGRVALTTPIAGDAADPDAGMTLFTSAAQATNVTASAWTMGDIWVTPQQVLRGPPYAQ